MQSELGDDLESRHSRGGWTRRASQRLWLSDCTLRSNFSCFVNMTWTKCKVGITPAHPDTMIQAFFLQAYMSQWYCGTHILLAWGTLRYTRVIDSIWFVWNCSGISTNVVVKICWRGKSQMCTIDHLSETCWSRSIVCFPFTMMTVNRQYSLATCPRQHDNQEKTSQFVQVSSFAATFQLHENKSARSKGVPNFAFQNRLDHWGTIPPFFSPT